MRTSMVLSLVAVLVSTAVAQKPAVAPEPPKVLKPANVLVLVNSKLDMSVALGRYYCDKRGVPLKNLVALPLPATDAMTEAEYDTLLAEPLRQAIADRDLTDTITCILTIRGVPFRMKAPPLTAEKKELADLIQQIIDKAKQRLAVDVELMKTIGVSFPDKARGVEDLAVLDKLFETIPPAPDEPGDIITVKAAYRSVSTARPIRIKRLLDADNRVLAQRQYLAVTQDAMGLAGLSERLRVLSPPGAPSADVIAQRLESLQRRKAGLFRNKLSVDVIEKMASVFEVTHGAIGVHDGMANRLRILETVTNQSAVDSELSLLHWKDYEREGGYGNPLYFRAKGNLPRVIAEKGKVLMVSRIDGPKVSDALRLIKDAIAVEAEGLKGIFYIDAKSKLPRSVASGDLTPKKRQWTGEQRFDASLSVLAMKLEQSNMPVILDQHRSVFQPGTCPNAALYVGWYNPRQYVPAFTWVRGAVGYHVSSFEAQHLRDSDSNEWVPRMIAAGVTATIGATDEPYVAAFPVPEEFFGLLLGRQMTVCEAYWLTVKQCSWRLILIADPLYNPFKNNPLKKKEPSSAPAGAGSSRSGG